MNLEAQNKDIPESSGNPLPTATPEVSTDSPNVENSTSVDQETIIPDVEITNMPPAYVSHAPKTSIHKIHPLDNVIGELQSGVKTRKQTKMAYNHGFISEIYESKKHAKKNECLFFCFLSQVEPKNVQKALEQ